MLDMHDYYFGVIPPIMESARLEAHTFHTWGGNGIQHHYEIRLSHSILRQKEISTSDFVAF